MPTRYNIGTRICSQSMCVTVMEPRILAGYSAVSLSILQQKPQKFNGLFYNCSTRRKIVLPAVISVRRGGRERKGTKIRNVEKTPELILLLRWLWHNCCSTKLSPETEQLHRITAAKINSICCFIFIVIILAEFFRLFHSVKINGII